MLSLESILVFELNSWAFDLELRLVLYFVNDLYIHMCFSVLLEIYTSRNARGMHRLRPH